MSKKKPVSDTVADAAPEPTIAAFKAFDKNLQCRGYQYEVGKTFEHAGTVRACGSGFHSCENPWDVLSYYPLIGDDGSANRFARVTASGTIERHSRDSKIASAKITIDAELKLPDFIVAGVNWLIDATKLVISSKVAGQEGDNGADDAQIGSSGYGARIGSSGNDAQIGSSGNDARIGSSGNDARIGSSGYGARIGSSGNDAQIGSSGYGAQIGSSGNGAQIDSSGERSVIASAGVNAMVKGALGAWLSVAEYEWNGAESRYDCIGFATGKVGDDGIPADTWLKAEGGKLVEA